LGEVPVGSIPTNNLKKIKKALVKFPNAISTTTHSLKETYRQKLAHFEDPRRRPYKIKKKER